MENSIKQSYRILQTIYLALITGVVLFQGVTIFMNDWQIPDFKQGLDPLNILSLLMLSLIPVGKIVADKSLNRIDPGAALAEKTAILQKALIIRWACIEGPTLFAIVAFMLLQDGKQLVVFLIGFAAFIMANPSKVKIAVMAKLNETEKKELFSN